MYFSIAPWSPHITWIEQHTYIYYHLSFFEMNFLRNLFFWLSAFFLARRCLCSTWSVGFCTSSSSPRDHTLAPILFSFVSSFFPNLDALPVCHSVDILASVLLSYLRSDLLPPPPHWIFSPFGRSSLLMGGRLAPPFSTVYSARLLLSPSLNVLFLVSCSPPRSAFFAVFTGIPAKSYTLKGESWLEEKL